MYISVFAALVENQACLSEHQVLYDLVSPRPSCPPLCLRCLAYYYGLSGRLPGWWSPSELDTQISVWL